MPDVLAAVSSLDYPDVQWKAKISGTPRDELSNPAYRKDQRNSEIITHADAAWLGRFRYVGRSKLYE